MLGTQFIIAPKTKITQTMASTYTTLLPEITNNHRHNTTGQSTKLSPPPQVYTSPIKHIHTTLTGRYLINRPHNNILNACPPDIHKSKQTLSRLKRTVLAQLCCGHCPLLQEYKYKINMSSSPICTRYNSLPDNIEHLLLVYLSLSFH